MKVKNIALSLIIPMLICFFAEVAKADTTWQSIGPFGGRVKSLAIDPTNNQNIYAGTDGGGVFKTTNGGASWTAASSGMTNIRVWSLTIDPTNSQTLYAGTMGNGIFKSNDGGTSWTAANNGMTNANILSLIIDPSNSRILYGGTYGGIVFKSINGGDSWTESNSGMTNSAINSLAINPTNSLTIYAGTSGGVFKSTNGGESWIEFSNGLTNKYLHSISVDLTNNQTLYAGTQGSGVFKSTNGGASWTAANSGITSRNVRSLTIDPSNSQTVYVGTFGGIFKSTDGGISWKAAFSGLTDSDIYALAIDPINSQTAYVGTYGGGVFKSINGGNLWTATNSGMTDTCILSLIIDPTNSQTAYAGTYGAGVFKSTNGGGSWTTANIGMPTSYDYVWSLAIDPANSQTLYAVRNGVFKSTNGGASWTAANSGLENKSVQTIAIDPTNSQTVYVGVYVATDGGGVFKSTNGGASWIAANSNISNTSIVSLAIDPTNSQTLYARTQVDGVYKSTNGGASWTAVSSGLTKPSEYVSSISIDPTNNQTVYAGAYSWGGGDGSVYKSINGGELWTASNNGMTNTGGISSIAVDPTNGQTVYAGTSNGVYKSINGGASWAAFNGGMNDVSVKSLVIDPTNSQTIYAGTGNMGIFKTVSSTIPTVSAPASISFNIGIFGSIKVSASGWPAPSLSVNGTMPNGLSFDPVTGILSGIPSIGSAGTYILLFTAGNGLPPDATKAVTVIVLPSSALNVTIATPSNNATVTSLASISGTASGSGLSKVEIQVTDGTYYLQSDSTFSTNPAWLISTGTSTWSRNTASVPWLEGMSYTITAHAIGSSGSTKVMTSILRIQPSISKQATILTFNLTPESIRAGENTTLSGNLVQTNTTPLAGRAVTVIITPPSTQDIPNPEPVISAYTTDSNGNFTSDLQFATTGVYMVQARYIGDATYQAATTTQSLGVTPHSGYAIIVVGKSPTDSTLFDQHLATATTAYNSLITKRGFLDADINTLISNKTGAAVTKQQIQDAIAVWARDKIAAAPAPLYLIMIDHGTSDGFMLGSDTLTPDELRGYMDTLESDPAVVASGALTNINRFVIIGTCYSGAFVSKLSKPGRVVIASAAADERSLSGYPIKASDNNTLLNGGENFIDALFNFLGRGDSFKTSFQNAVSMVNLRDPRKIDLGPHSGSYDTLAQHPLLNDSGTGAGSYLLDGGTDGVLVASHALGVGIKSPGNPADIQAVTPTAFLSPDAGDISKLLWLQVNNNSRVARAWVEIRTPNTTTSGGSSGQVIPNLATLPLIYDGNNWIGTWSGFTVAGTYDILYYTQDNQTQDISPAAHSVVYKQLAGNTAPSAFNLVSPENAATTDSTFVFNWQESNDPDGLTYTLLVSTDNAFSNIVHRQEDIPIPATYILENTLKNPATGQYYCQNGDAYCYWKVQAIDKYGDITESNIHSFTIVLTSSIVNSIVTGTILNPIGIPVPSATLQIGTEAEQGLISGGNGVYMIATPTSDGTTANTVTVRATGYKLRTIPITLTAGTAVTSTIYLESDACPTGDIDDDGKVDISDALKVLRIIVGLVPATEDSYARADVSPLKDGKPAPDGFITISDALVILKKVVGLVSW